MRTAGRPRVIPTEPSRKSAATPSHRPSLSATMLSDSLAVADVGISSEPTSSASAPTDRDAAAYGTHLTVTAEP